MCWWKSSPRIGMAWKRRTDIADGCPGIKWCRCHEETLRDWWSKLARAAGATAVLGSVVLQTGAGAGRERPANVSGFPGRSENRSTRNQPNVERAVANARGICAAKR